MIAFGPRIPIVACDWDGNLADTFTPSPRGRGVEAGYRHALGEIFGNPELLDEIGGLRNQAPGEVVQRVLQLHPELRARGLAYHDRRARELRGLVPRGKGIGKGHADQDAVLYETLVRVRLEYLLPEITPEWPRPFPGAVEALDHLRRRGRVIAIVSSGHEAFITKTLKVWGAVVPQIIVTDDDMRALGLPPEQSSKPHPNVMKKMLEQAHLSTIMSSAPFGYFPDMVIGDCEFKDRALAKNVDVPFWWFNPKRRPAPTDFGPQESQFHSWTEIPDLLK